MKLKGNKNGFTLIELLAVIVILSVIALISTPIILEIISKVKKSAFLDSAYGILESAKLFFTENVLEEGFTENKTFLFENGTSNGLGFNGTNPKGGSLTITVDGKISLAIHNKEWCAKKNAEETSIVILKYEESTCKQSTLDEPLKKVLTFEDQMKLQPNETLDNDPDHNLRYVGSDPKNYILFNNELWRVIGVFNGQAKIIKSGVYNESIAWDANQGNNFKDSTLQGILNQEYLNSIESTSKSYIDDAHVWNLGGFGNDYTSTGIRANYYTKERESEVLAGQDATFTGAIGLMYPSDYGYSTSSVEDVCETGSMYSWQTSTYDVCRNNSWLVGEVSQWTLTASSTNAGRIFYINSTGNVNRNNSTDMNAVRPVLFLKSNVKIKSGTGTSSDPFNLIM